MFKRKKGIFTPLMFTILEQIRQAIEVVTGKRTCFVQMNLNYCEGTVCVDNEEIELTYVRMSENLMYFNLNSDRYTAQFQDNGRVAVMDRDNPHKIQTVAGECTLQWVGRSYTERHERPILDEKFEHNAKKFGLTLEELLSPI